MELLNTAATLHAYPRRNGDRYFPYQGEIWEVRGRLDIRELTFRRIDAERNVLQQRGELSKLTSEQLLDATSTYVDMLSARTARAISLEAETRTCSMAISSPTSLVVKSRNWTTWGRRRDWARRWPVMA